MNDHLPPENSIDNEPETERVDRFKEATRLIINTREKMPRSARWHLSLRRTLWRYTQAILIQKRNYQSRKPSTEEEICDNQS